MATSYSQRFAPDDRVPPKEAPPDGRAPQLGLAGPAYLGEGGIGVGFAMLLPGLLQLGRLPLGQGSCSRHPDRLAGGYGQCAHDAIRGGQRPVEVEQEEGPAGLEGIPHLGEHRTEG